MTTNTRKGPIVDPGLCRCCGAMKKCRLLNVEYEWLGTREVYSDMFVDCFGLLLSHLEGEESERLICATCVVRLRDARAFRQQVLQREEILLNANIKVHDEEDCCTNTHIFKSELEVKVEPEDVCTATEEPVQTDDQNLNIGDGNQVPDVNVDDGNEAQDLDGDMDDTYQPDEETEADNASDSSIKIKIKKSPKKKKLKTKSKTAKRKKTEPECRQVKLRSGNVDVQDTGPKPLSPPAKRNIDNEQKILFNTITIVENSYVCPFNSSFSDYFCIYCRQGHTDPNRLREHTLTHDPKTFKDIVSIKKQIQIDIFRIDCRLCSITIDDLQSFKTHITSAHGITLFDVSNEFLKFRLTVNNLTCIECDSNFGFFHALKKHMAEHFGTCICDICGAHYFEERMLILHQKTHKKVDLCFPCKDCGKVFKSKHSRYLHEAKMHRKEPAYQCYKCDSVFFTYSLRYRHMIDSHGEERMFPCDHCDRAYDSRKSLREHNRRHHLKVLKHQCDLCDKRFYLPSRLKEHMATHTGERNFRCEFCGKSYPRLRGLNVHIQSHVSFKKFNCLVCNATFTQNFNLRNHMKRQHQSLSLEEGNE
uniref:SFRICE_007079 n=1 Tax=Spodoptera frugiperda TaxID=7108 RepID=A0A2H1VP71_SPOFR